MHDSIAGVMVAAVFLTLSCCSTALAQDEEKLENESLSAAAAPKMVVLDTLAGPLPANVQARRNPYLVVSDIEVPPGKTVTIEAGAVFLFRNFTGLHVQGKLFAEGTRTRPIVFTSELDQRHNPASTMFANPYDWNGVYLHADAFGSLMAHCEIAYSVYGLMSETKFVRLNPVVFRENGKSNFVIEKVDQHAPSDEPYDYVLSVKDATIDGVSVKLLKDPLAPRRNVLRYVGLAAFLGGCGAGIYQIFQAMDSQADLDAASGTDFDNLRYGSTALWEKYQDARNTDVALCIAGFAIGAIGGFGFAWSFSF